MFSPNAAVVTVLVIVAGCDSARACLKFPAAVVVVMKPLKVKNAAALQRLLQSLNDETAASASDAKHMPAALTCTWLANEYYALMHTHTCVESDLYLAAKSV